MQYKIAELSDIDATLKLHRKYQIDSLLIDEVLGQKKALKEYFKVELVENYT